MYKDTMQQRQVSWGRAFQVEGRVSHSLCKGVMSIFKRQ